MTQSNSICEEANGGLEMLFETGLSGTSSLCVFWRMRMASVEVIDRL
jgi:hypothetical protein